MWLLKAIGKAVEWFKGAGATTAVPGEEVHRTVRLTYHSETITYEVVSRRVVYTTRYKNKLLPAHKRAAFEVQGTVILGEDHVMNPLVLKEKVVFPDMSSIGLSQTEYPHVRAITAYIDLVIEQSQRSADKTVLHA